MKQWFKLTIAIISIINIAVMLFLCIYNYDSNNKYNERIIDNQLDVLLELAKTNYNNNNQIVDYQNSVALKTMAILARASTVSLLNRVDYIKKDIFASIAKLKSASISEPGPDGIAEKKICTQPDTGAFAQQVRGKILQQFNQIAIASFSALNDENIEVQIYDGSKIIYQSKYRLLNDVTALKYSHEILLPVGGSTVALELKMSTPKKTVEFLKSSDSYFSSWLHDGGVVYGVYWIGFDRGLKSLWYNQPADELLEQIQMYLVPWPDEYQSRKIKLKDKTILTWIKPIKYKGKKAVAVALYANPASKSVYFIGILLINIAVLIGLAVLSPPKPLIINGELRKRRSQNHNTNLSTLRSDPPPPNPMLVSKKRSRNTEIVRNELDSIGVPDIMHGAKSEVLKSLLKKMRE